MADTPELTPEVKSFMEKARAQGYSDDEIVGYVKEHYVKKPSAPAAQAAPAPEVPFQFNENLKERFPKITGGIEGMIGGAEGLKRGIMRFPARVVEGTTNMLSDPEGTLKALPGAVASMPRRVMQTISHAGSDPVSFGEGVADLEGNLAMTAAGMPKSVAGMTPLEAVGAGARGVASAAEKHPALAGAAIGAMHSGIPGAIEGAAGGPIASRAIRIIGRAADRLAPSEGATAAATAPEKAESSLVMSDMPADVAKAQKILKDSGVKAGDSLATIRGKIFASGNTPPEASLIQRALTGL